MSFIYLASPYSHPESAIRHQRYEQAKDFTADCMKQGHIIFSPIANNHLIAVEHDLPKDFDFWMTFDLAFLRVAEKLWILMLEGWDESKGVQKERETAALIGIKETLVEPL